MKSPILLLLLCSSSLFPCEKTLITTNPLKDKIVYEVLNGPLQYLTDHQRKSMVGYRVDTIINNYPVKKKYVWFSPIYSWNKAGYGKKPSPLIYFEALDSITDHILFIVGKNKYQKIDWSRRGRKMVIIPKVSSL